MGYKTGIDREQTSVYPMSLESYITQDNPVRVIDAFVDWLDLSALCFTHSVENTKGTSVYSAATLLKLYIYGYINRVRSSRRLAKECERNIELHWLLKRLTPEYHTISDFRKDNPVALKSVFKEFTQFCIATSLIEGETIAFDGTKIHAQNNQKNNFNAKRLEKLLARIESKAQAYEQYLIALDEQDKAEDVQPKVVVPVGKTKTDIEKTLDLLAQRRKQYEAFQEQLKTAAQQGCPTEELQISTIDPDARAMVFKKNHTEIGYNVQTAGDAKHKLIVHFDITNVNDTHALSELAITTKDILHKKEDQSYNALADAGYHTGSELALCTQNNIITFVCPTDTVDYTTINQPNVEEQSTAFTKNQFIYDDKEDTYTCPNNQKLRTNGTWYVDKPRARRKKERKTKRYTLPSKVCQECPFAANCQRNAVKQWHGKTIERSEYDDAVDANRKRIILNPNAYKQRKEIIEHPFGTIKRTWGYHYTLLKTKKKVAGEFALIFLAYNFRRVLSILGVEGLKQALNNVKPTINLFVHTFFTLFRAYFPQKLHFLSFLAYPLIALFGTSNFHSSPFFNPLPIKSLFCTV